MKGLIRTKKKNLNFKEHYILQNLKSNFFGYILLVALSIVFALIVHMVGFEVSEDTYISFTRIVFSISITTITFAVPNCMRNIFAAYEDYYSTTIKEILLDRFPITKLVLSAFTTLMLTVLVMCGFIGKVIPLPLDFMLPFVLFWCVVCVIYLFISLEKMIHFVTHAPEAILEKLEFGIEQNKNLETRDDYDEFRRHLASINDIASTIVAKSTGRDSVITDCLHSFVVFHKDYLTRAVKEENPEVRKLYFRACRSVQQELMRIYREAASSMNEHATGTIIKTYCKMTRDAVTVGADYLYISELLNQIERFQSYAIPTRIERIQEQAATDWFFMMMKEMADVKENTGYLRICMSQQLAGSLKNLTVNGETNLFSHFMRVASNSDIDITLDDFSYEWLALCDYSLLLYLEWLYTNMPELEEKVMRTLDMYSLPHHNRMRSVLCNSEDRWNLMIREEKRQKFILDGNREEDYEYGFNLDDPRISAGTEAILGITPETTEEKKKAHEVIRSYAFSQ